MKRIILFMAVVLAAAVLAGAAATSTGFSLGEVASFTISADASFTDAAGSKQAQDIDAVKKLLLESERSAKPQGAAELARLQLQSSQGSVQEYIIWNQEGTLYAQQGEKVRRIDSNGFFTLCNARIGNDLYRYRLPKQPLLTPQGQQSGEAKSISPALIKTSYSYRELDGRYYLPGALQETGQIPKVELAAGRWPELSWSGSGREPAEVLCSFTKADGTIFSGGWQECAEQILEAGGSHRVSIVANYQKQGDSATKGEIVYQLEAVAPRASVSFSVTGADTYPGEVLVLRAHNVPQGDAISFRSDIQFVPNFFSRGNGEWMALFPASYFNAVGEHYVEMEAGGVSQRFAVALKDKQWQIQNLTVDSSTASETIESQQANAEYERVIAPLRPVAHDKQYWSGGFLMPVSDHNITTQFGMVRYVNGAPTSVRHGALDLAVPRGTPVAATNSGHVLYAGFLQLTGNTVLIEHGYGLKSWYYHMDSLHVKTGDQVEKGAKIGEVGSTGFSTGPHLHFGMSVNNVFVNPNTIINTDLLPE